MPMKLTKKVVRVTTVICDNCPWRGPMKDMRHQLMDIKHLWTRLDPGGEVPAGVCPECGALVYLFKPERPIEPRTYAEVRWCRDDIKTLRPRWSLARCEEFLASIQKNLQGLMTERGWAVIEDELAGVR